MENVALMVVALLPLGLVGLSAYLFIKRKMRKKPELAIVSQQEEKPSSYFLDKTRKALSNIEAKKPKKKRSRKGKRK